MKEKIRRSVFETNSSSVHTLSIIKDTERIDANIKPDTVVFDSGYFGWELDKYTDTETKASYLWEAIIDSCSENNISDVFTKIETIKNILAEYNIKAEFPYANTKIETWVDSKGVEHNYTVFVNSEGEKDDGYIDHGYELREFIDDILSDKTKLINFLFDNRSYIVTGNDNTDDFVSCPDYGDSWDYIKGN